MNTFHCKMCGLSKEFETKKEFQKFKEIHRPKMSKGQRGYNCSFKTRHYYTKKGSYRETLIREDLYNKLEGLEESNE